MAKCLCLKLDTIHTWFVEQTMLINSKPIYQSEANTPNYSLLQMKYMYQFTIVDMGFKGFERLKYVMKFIAQKPRIVETTNGKFANGED